MTANSIRCLPDGNGPRHARPGPRCHVCRADLPEGPVAVVVHAVLGVALADLLGGAVGGELLQGLGDLLGALGVAELEAHGVVLGGEGLVEHDEGVGVGRGLVGGDGQVAGYGVHQAAFELGEGVVVVRDLVEGPEGGGEVGPVALEDLEGGGVHLGGHGASGQAVVAPDAGALLHHDHLLVEHVGLGEGVLVLTALHGEAVPDAVDGPLVHEGVLGVPVDGLALQLPAEPVADGLGQVEVEAAGLAVVADEAVGRVGVVVAHHELLGGRLGLGGAVGRPLGAGGEPHEGEACEGAADEGGEQLLGHGSSSGGGGLWPVTLSQ